MTLLTRRDLFRSVPGGIAGAALASLFAGTVTTLVIAAAGPPLAGLALLFQSPDYVAVMVLGLVAAVVLAQGSLLKAIAMIVLGVFLGLMGTDVTTSMQRYTFGVNALFDGIGFVPLAMGLFGMAEIMLNLEATHGQGRVMRPRDRLWPSRADFRRATPAAVRGTALGVGLGILPGSTTDIPAYVRTMEHAIVAALAEEGIEARGRDHEGPQFTGVWVEDRKIASIGVHVSKGVTTHGFAINVDNDVEPFHQVTACGLPGVRMTSIALETGRIGGLRCFRKRMAYAFARAHGRRQRIVPPARLDVSRVPVPV